MWLISCPLRAAPSEDTSGGGRKAGPSFHADGATGASASGFTPAPITGASLSSGAAPAPGLLQLRDSKCLGCADACWPRSILQLRAVPDQPGRSGRGRNRCGCAPRPVLRAPGSCPDLLPAAVLPCMQHLRTQGTMRPGTPPPVPDGCVRAPGVNIVPQVINIALRGAQALPIGFNVNPAVILVNAQGAQAWPRCPPCCDCARPAVWCARTVLNRCCVCPGGAHYATGIAWHAGIPLSCCWHSLMTHWHAGVSTCSRRSSQLCRRASRPGTRAWRLRPTGSQLCPLVTGASRVCLVLS